MVTLEQIVAEFGRLAGGAEYTDFLILDGPGSKPTTAPTTRMRIGSRSEVAMRLRWSSSFSK